MPLVKEIVKFAIETLVFQNGSIGSKETLKWRSFHLRYKTSLTSLKEVIFAEINFCEMKNFAISENLFSQISFFELFRGN